MAFLIPELPRCSAFELAAAVRRTITEGPTAGAAKGLSGKLPSSDALREAGDTVAAREAHGENARALALLEAPYIVAASDGLEPQERQAFSALITHLVGSAPADAVCDVLDWFDQRLAEEGVDARIAYIADHFESRREREQVLGFSTLLALADRRLALSEQTVLLRLAEALGFKRAEVQMLVHQISLRLERAMAVSLQPIPSAPPDDEPILEDESIPDDERETQVPETPRAGSRRGAEASAPDEPPPSPGRVPPTERSS